MIKITNQAFSSLIKSKYYNDKSFNEKVLAIIDDNKESLKQPYINTIKNILTLTEQEEKNITNNLNFMGDNSTQLTIPRVELKDVFLSQQLAKQVQQFLKEYYHKELLANYGLSIPHHLLFSGDSGMGKSMLAEALAKELQLPFFKVNITSLIDSHIGNTSQNLHLIYQRMEINKGIYLFDEFDSIATSRSSNTNESANKEFNSVLTQLLKDMEIPLNENSIAIYTTNKRNFLDNALMRRFDLELYFPNFDFLCRKSNKPYKETYIKYAQQYAEKHNVPSKIFTQSKIDYNFKNYSELKALCDNLLKKYILKDAQ